jgi:hypothetical protein
MAFRWFDRSNYSPSRTWSKYHFPHASASQWNPPQSKRRKRLYNSSAILSWWESTGTPTLFWDRYWRMSIHLTTHVWGSCWLFRSANLINWAKIPLIVAIFIKIWFLSDRVFIVLILGRKMQCVRRCWSDLVLAEGCVFQGTTLTSPRNTISPIRLPTLVLCVNFLNKLLASIRYNFSFNHKL